MRAMTIAGLVACLFGAGAMSAMPPEAVLTPNDPASLKPLALVADNTVIVTPAAQAGASDAKAAQLLQKWLRKATQSEAGFEILGAKRPADLAGKAVIAVGRTEWVADADVAGLYQDGYVLRRKGNVVVLARGATEKASLWAAVGFLDRFCGVRFYMPGDLFTGVPKDPKIVLEKVDVRVEPYVRAGAAHPWPAPNSGEWGEYWALIRRPTSHQHTMYERFPPEKFAEKYPKIYPIIDGKRYLPQKGDQKWQPVLSEPTLVDAAVESADEFFRQMPDCPYVAFSVQDARTYGEQDMNSEVVKKLGKDKGLSHLFWTFINETAKRVEQKHPGKNVLALAYSDVRTPPSFKLEKNVIVCMVFTMADIVIDDVFGDKTDQPSWAEQWAKVASQIGQHDWSYGYGYLIPRIYTNLVQRTFLEFEKMNAPIRFAYWELGPNWGLDGSKLYQMVRIWWDPHTDVKADLKQFCDDLFGPASAEMDAYFTKLEKCHYLMVLDAERKLNKWSNQFMQNAEQRALTQECRGHLDKALALAAGDETAKARIELFSKTFRYSEYLMDIANAKTVTQAQIDAVKKYAAEVIEPDPMTIQRSGKDGVVKQLDQVLAVITKGKLAP